MRQELLAVLVAGLVIAILGVGSFVNLGGQQSVKTSPAGSSSSSVEGVVLNANISSETLSTGGSLGITVSLFNSLPTANNLTAISYNSSSWKFVGFPVAMWGGCAGIEPVEFMIVRGNYDVAELQSAAVNSTTPGISCPEGGSVLYVSFLPWSSNATTTGFFCIASCTPDHFNWNLTSSFSVNGYWTYPLNGSEVGDIYTPATWPGAICNGGSPCGVTYNFPEVGPIAQHAFTPGWYTFIASDEWGQFVLMHFSVV